MSLDKMVARFAESRYRVVEACQPRAGKSLSLPSVKTIARSLRIPLQSGHYEMLNSLSYRNVFQKCAVLECGSLYSLRLPIKDAPTVILPGP